MHRFIPHCLKFGTKLNRIQASYRTVIPSYSSFQFKELKSPHFVRTCYTRVRPSNDTLDNIRDLKLYLNEDKHIHLRFITNILDKVKDFEKLSEEDIIVLLQQCGRCVPNESNQSRNDVCQRIYGNIKKFKNVSINVYNTYIKVCTENRILLNYEEFVTTMKVKPDAITFKLLLKNVCERGDVDQAFDILNDMKTAQLSVDDEVFNDLVLGHTIFGGLKDGENVLQTMKSALVQETNNTKLSLLKGVCLRKDSNDVNTALLHYSFECDQPQFLELLEAVGIGRKNEYIDKIVSLFYHGDINKEFIRKLEQLCIYLINMKNPEAAINIYSKFVTTSKEQQKYSVFLFREMLHCNISVELIIKLAKQIKAINPYIFENLIEIAFKHRYTSSAWILFKELPVLRTHYFWPILATEGYRQGEDAVMTALQRMIQMKVRIDEETLELYCFPYCNAKQPHILIDKLKKLGITVKEILPPLITHFLYNEKTETAAELCDSYGVQLSGDRILKVLPPTWSKTKDAKSLVHILKKICISNITQEDFVGEFLIKCLKTCKPGEDLKPFLNLLEVVDKSRLKINPASADLLLHFYTNRTKNRKLLDLFSTKIDSLMDYSLKSEPQQYIHPRDMNLEQLECHLVELKSKKMETRGVLRRLIQNYSSTGNNEKVTALRKEFITAGYEESAGMKSSTMYSYVQCDRLKPALDLYKELKEKHQQFKLDEFKVLDLGALMVKEGMEKEAIDLIKNESLNRSVTGGAAIQKNCLRLLSYFNDVELQFEMFNLLIDNDYCKASNIILGPLVRIHFKKNDIQKAVEVFSNLSEKYACTPLKLELLCAILDAGEQLLLQKALDATSKIHGAKNTQETLIVALAEKGLHKPLRSLLKENKQMLDSRLSEICDRWIKETDLNALQTLLLAVGNQNFVDITILHSAIVKVFCLNNDCEGAIKFWENLKENEVFISNDLEKQLGDLLIKNHYRIPDNLRLTN